MQLEYSYEKNKKKNLTNASMESVVFLETRKQVQKVKGDHFSPASLQISRVPF